VSRTWRKVKSDWDAWNTRSLADEPIVRSSGCRDVDARIPELVAR
jgi:hypothetical protein